MVKMVVLDGFTLNPGDMKWDALERLGEVSVYDRTDAARVLQRIGDAEVVFTNKTPLPEQVIRKAPQLKYIGVLATGYNIVDVGAARERGITVTNVPAYGTYSVAQHTFALILELTTQVGTYSHSVRSGEWSNQPDFCYYLGPLTELHGKTLGIVGLGRIGQAVARIAMAFGMEVIAYHTHPDRDRMEGVRFGDLETCFAESDVVSLHCPLTSSNTGFVNRDLLQRMRPGAYLINVSRGQLINELDLAEALTSGVLAGAAVDVLSKEPPPVDHPLTQAPNCIVTPHIAWASRSARERLMHIAVENVRSWLNGHPTHVVS